MKNCIKRRLFVAGAFVGEVNSKKRDFWLNVELAKTYFDELILFSGSEHNCVGQDGLREEFVPAWLYRSKIKISRFVFGVAYLFILLLASPRFLKEVAVLEFKALPFVFCHIKSLYRLPGYTIRSVCGMGHVANVLRSYEMSSMDTVVVWSEHLTGMRLLKRHASLSGAKIIYSEYGELPGKMFICGMGMFHESWHCCHKVQFKALPVSDDEMEEASHHIQKILKARISTKTDQYDTGSNLEDIALETSRPLIYINAVQPHGSGLLPRCSDFSKEYSPMFASNQVVLNYFARLGNKYGWNIIYKDHPNTYNYFPGQIVRDRGWGEHVKIVSNVDIYEILALADVTVSLGSKTVYLSLLSQVPVILLGPYSIAPNDLDYGVYSCCKSEQSIVAAVNSCLNLGVDYDGLNAYLTRLLKYYYYSMDNDDISLFGRGRQSFWDDFLDFKTGGRSVISAKVKV